VRAWLYDAAIRPLTTRWYHQVLQRLPDGARLLDVGIGTGGALIRNASLVRRKQVEVVGVDIDADYVRRCQAALWKAGLADQVRVYLQSIYDHHDGPYDAVYFSASFMLIPDPPAVLRHVRKLLTPGGKVYFTQTFEEKRDPLVEQIKPILHKLTTIDFGEVTYEEDFLRSVQEGGLVLEEMATLGRSGQRTFRLAVGVPEGANPPRQLP
jgi:cyclopropane fatty-acyl-phospholipid synthase-like methyltransferase